MEATGHAMWEWIVPNDVVNFTGNWLQILGYEPEDVAHSRKAWFSLIAPEDRKRTDAAVQAHLCGHQTLYDSEYRMRHADGNVREGARRAGAISGQLRGRLNRGLAARAAAISIVLPATAFAVSLTVRRRSRRCWRPWDAYPQVGDWLVGRDGHPAAPGVLGR